jgi:NTE family protein
LALRGRRHRPRYNRPAVVEPEPFVIPEFEGDTFVWVALSGGGTRAAALAWKVLETLRQIPFPRVVDGERRISTLADEIDVISGISGGSFAAAAWCLSRNAPEEFRHRVLQRDLEHSIGRRLAHPLRLARLLSPEYDRINAAAELYDQEIFDGATFGDLPPRPDLRIHATHLALGARFSFTPADFRLIGSDLSSYPIGYACAASSAFPILLSPMTLLNHGETLTPDELIKRDRHSYGKLVRGSRDDVETYLRRIAHEYLNDKSNAFVHLADGGLVDNQGLQAVIDGFLQGQVINQRLNYRESPLRRLVIINVNAGTLPRDISGQSAAAPSVDEVVKYTMVASMDVLSAKRWIRVRDACTERFVKAVDVRESDLTDEERDRKLAYWRMESPYAIEISFRKILDEQLRNRCFDVPTRFALEPHHAEAIDAAAPELIRQDEHMLALGRSLAEELADDADATERLRGFFGSALDESPRDWGHDT